MKAEAAAPALRHRQPMSNHGRTSDNKATVPVDNAFLVFLSVRVSSLTQTSLKRIRCGLAKQIHLVRTEQRPAECRPGMKSAAFHRLRDGGRKPGRQFLDFIALDEIYFAVVLKASFGFPGPVERR